MERGRLGLTARAAGRWARDPQLFVKLSTVIMLSLGCASTMGGHPKRSAEQVARVAHSDGWLAMGTFFEIDVRMPESQSLDVLAWIEDARREIARLERIYSRHDATSELSDLNRHRAEWGDEGLETFTSSAELSALLAEAERLNRMTAGAFDVAIDPSSLDLDAISKGAVLDHLRASFAERFAGAAALFSFGQSSVAAIGDPDGQGWRLLLQSRDPRRGFLGEVRLRDQSLSMSSSLVRVEDADRAVGSHVIDPRTGRPVAGTVEAVVISDSAMYADAWSTALLVIGRLPPAFESSSRDEFDAMLIDDVGKVFRTLGWPGPKSLLEMGD
jgi:thiamine biosynthesis lipoprotein ApbE